MIRKELARSHPVYFILNLCASVMLPVLLISCGDNGDSSSSTSSGAIGTFTATGMMTSPRSMPTANLLLDGRVLVAGGIGSSAIAVASADLYDPISRTFSATGSMSFPRDAAASARLLDGRIFVAGGEDNTATAIAAVELYNPATGTWTLTSSMSTPRVNPTATLLDNGKVLVVGGYSIDDNSFPLASAEIYDPATGIFSATGSLSTARRNHTATLLNNGKVLVAGGYNGGDSSNNLDAPEIYDPATGIFSVTGSMGTPRRYPTANLLLDGKVLVVGGYGADNVVLASASLYNTQTSTFSYTGAMNTPTGRQTATLLIDGKVLIAGGYNGVNALSSAELYDPVAGKFFVTGSMTVPRWRHSEARLLNGDVLIVGGKDDVAALASAETYARK